MRRLRQPGLTSTWINNLSIGDQGTLYMHPIRKVDPTRKNKLSSHSVSRGGSLDSNRSTRGSLQSKSNSLWNQSSTSNSATRGLPQSKAKSLWNQSSTSNSATRGLPQSKTKSLWNQSSTSDSATRALPQSKTKASSR